MIKRLLIALALAAPLAAAAQPLMHVVTSSNGSGAVRYEVDPASFRDNPQVGQISGVTRQRDGTVWAIRWFVKRADCVGPRGVLHTTEFDGMYLFDVAYDRSDRGTVAYAMGELLCRALKGRP